MESHTPDEDQAIIALLKKYNYDAFALTAENG